MGEILFGVLYWGYIGLGLIMSVVIAYLLLLTILCPIALLQRRRVQPAKEGARRRFAFLVPAYNEELLIARAVQDLLSQDYPRELFDVHVVADNCTDQTAERARGAGAIVHERNEPDNRGKGQALHWLQRIVLDWPVQYDGFIIVDADTVATHNLLQEMNRLFANGAQAVQAYNTVLNGNDSWGSNLRYVALVLLHYLRPLGRSVFGGSAGLKGNGMCLSREVLAGEKWDAFSVTEDIQFHLNLLMRGITAQYASQAAVLSDMPVTLGQAYSQNLRWESGRLHIARVYVPKLIFEGIRRHSLVLLDAAMEQLIPPFSVLFGLTGLYLIGALAVDLVSGHAAPLSLAVFMIVGQIIYTLSGLILVRAPGRVYLGLLYAPVYIAWKIFMYAKLALGKEKPTEWVRTERETGPTIP